MFFKTYPVSDHCDGRRFFNPSSHSEDRPKGRFFSFLKWIRGRHTIPWEEVQVLKAERPPQRVSGGKIRITCVNHMTFLIQTMGLNILTDPVWSEFASPVQFTGPRRHAAQGLVLEDLPPVDVILLSHNHYDHMDLPTLRTICRVHQPLIVAPLGNKRYLKSLRKVTIQELDWWQSTSTLKGLRVTAVPARHFAKRGLFDIDRALWCGFVLETSKDKIYFSGDTGWDTHFEKIAKKFPKLKAALIPAGAYLPQWFMKPIHLNPEEAVRAFQTLGATYGLAGHFGTFQLGEDAPQEAVDGLMRAMKKHRVSSRRLFPARNGMVSKF